MIVIFIVLVIIGLLFIDGKRRKITTRQDCWTCHDRW